MIVGEMGEATQTVGFSERVLKPALATSRGVVYVLPEMRSLKEVFSDRANDL